MGYARLEAEGLIIGTQEWQQRQKEKEMERLQRLLNGEIDMDSKIMFTYAGRKNGGARREGTKRHIEEVSIDRADTWTHTGKS